MQHLGKGIPFVFFRLVWVGWLFISAQAADTLKPTFVVTAPKTSARLTNATVVVSGTARDNVRVDRVSVQVNGGAIIPAESSNVFTNWTAAVELIAGPNTLRVFAVDTAGNKSTTNQIAVTYVVNAPVAVSIEGLGTIAPNIATQLLEIGKSYAVTAAPGKGYVFKGWSGSTNSLPARLSFVMRSNLTFNAKFVDNTKPTIKLVAPAKTVRTTAPTIAVTGTALDNGPMDGVFFRVRGGAWEPVMTANHWTNWNATAALEPGPNLIEVYALDAATNASAIVSSTVTYALCSSFPLSIGGPGTVTGATNEQCLEIGKTYTVTATPRTGAAFVKWTGATNSTATRLTFVMRAGFNLQAEFRDAAKPMLVVKSPLNNAIVGTNKLTVMGTATDNAKVAHVYARVNGGNWFLSAGTTNWNFTARIEPGPNVIEVVAEDAAQNRATNRSVVNWTKSILDTYWPMKVGDFAFFTNAFNSYYTDQVRATSDGSPGFVLLEGGGAASLVRYSADRKKMQWQGLADGSVLVAFIPNITIVDENFLINGGTLTETGEAAFREGAAGDLTSLQVIHTISVTKIGKVKTNLGAFYNVRQVDVRTEFIGPGGRSASVGHYYLAPWAGRIRQGLDENGAPNWHSVQDAWVNGFDVHLFGEIDGLALLPAEIETGLSAMPPATHFGPTLAAARQAAAKTPNSSASGLIEATGISGLTIDLTSEGLVISWTAHGCALEQSANFSAWSEFAGEVKRNDDSYTAKITPQAEAKFFRLRSR